MVKFNSSPSASVAAMVPIDAKFSSTLNVSESISGALSFMLVIFIVISLVVSFSPSDAVASNV